MNVQTINDIFFNVVQRDLPRIMLHKKNAEWVPISSRELYRNVVGVARVLRSWGIAKGDRVAILSENRPEWAVADFASMLLGAAVVPIYPTLTADQTLYLLNDSGARVIFVSTPVQLEKVLSIRDHTALEHIVLMEDGASESAAPMRDLMAKGPTERDPDFDRQALAVAPCDLATIMYTSGTTGTPKGAMLTQGNLASNLFHSLDFYGLGPSHLSISFLPLSHITSRHVDYAMFWHGVTIAYCPIIDELKQVLAEVHPTVLVGVPRVYEKLHNQVIEKIGNGSKRKLYEWAIKVGRKNRYAIFDGKRPRDPRWMLADLLVYSKIRKSLGGRVQVFVSGGAPLNRDLIDWYGSIGIRIFEGYGMTETSPVIALNNPKAYRPGSVGRCLSNLQVRIADDGEILVKGPSVFQGYWNKALETATAFEGGWFHTGDIGHIDEDGFLYVTDRKKDLIKTSGGKFIAPQPIELSLKSNPLVAEAAVIGDRRKFPMVIIAPQFSALERWAMEAGVSAPHRESLVADERVQALYKEIVGEANQKLARFEKIKKVLVVPDEFTVANGALTPTLKLKRRVIEERYGDLIDRVYSAPVDSAAA
ncbi:MAG TPA: long-chain fatty acid--CoA ligase [Terriglobales bacterium]|nr:long-chain fatty acid--CoA ligase [Terriglobales bacterium]